MNQIKNEGKHVRKEWCSVCNIQVNRTSIEQHLKGKKHIFLVNQMKMKQRISQQVSIFLNIFYHLKLGIPRSLRKDKLVKHFKQFGQVIAILRNEKENTGLLQFRTRMQADMALSYSHHVEGSLLGVQPRNQVEHLTNSPSKGLNLSRAVGLFDQIEVFERKLEETLKSNAVIPVDEQIHLLVKIVETTEEEKSRKSHIISSLEEWLSLEFPGCCLHLFGSSVTGLAFRNDSDLDIFLEIPANDEGHAEADASLSNDELTDEKKREYMLKTLRRASNIIRSHPDITDLVVVSNARIPVSKFVYSPIGVKCDLTCNNIIAVQNSKLLYSLQSLDVRIRPYLYALKFWAKSHRLISSPESTLSSYALTLMAVFYLQQTDPPLVPSIESLQSEVPQEEKIHFNGWNISFQVPLDRGKPPTQAASEMSIIDLLIGFFRFYQKLNANEVVVCPRIGKCLPKTEFVDAPHSPEGRSTFLCNDKQGDSRPPLKLSLLSVQDLFELNFNVSFNFRHFELFQSLCESAERTCLRIVDVEKNDKQSVLPALFEVPLKTKFASKAKRNHIQSSLLPEFVSLDDVASLENVKKLFQSRNQNDNKQRKLDGCDFEVLIGNDSIIKLNGELIIR
ncbi:hypothetical protein DAPPUDRAFT_325455 [Daphnia pulex]|uniref:U1-type domain-containing protein n=1 Tax=Daphnia pulex TaxID=6669 RepID=E9H4S3_DAPPU|nr:hypothetical protein DAPPUDRAFT_325455 [Daphnia pulex]|eukprot:EFX73198.1 hypothetical protein DAPPUDRAFT_325455 [Daphnia pulex]